MTLEEARAFAQLRSENAELRQKLAAGEARVAELTQQLAAALVRIDDLEAQGEPRGEPPALVKPRSKPLAGERHPRKRRAA